MPSYDPTLVEPATQPAGCSETHPWGKELRP